MLATWSRAARASLAMPEVDGYNSAGPMSSDSRSGSSSQSHAAGSRRKARLIQKVLSSGHQFRSWARARMKPARERVMRNPEMAKNRSTPLHRSMWRGRLVGQMRSSTGRWASSTKRIATALSVSMCEKCLPPAVREGAAVFPSLLMFTSL